MTEDDTFDALRRPAFDDMLLIINELSRAAGWHLPSEDWDMLLRKTLEEHGWDNDSYMNLWNNRFRTSYVKYV